MTWQNRLKADPLPWLLESDEAGVRYLALRDLADSPAGDPQMLAAREAAHRTGPIAQILAQMQEPGYWVKPGPGYSDKYRSSVWSIIFLAQLGASLAVDERIARACAYILENALIRGEIFTSNSVPSGTVICLQGNLCWALTELGCVDARLDGAYDWLARSITGEGIAPREEKTAKVRYYSGLSGPGFECGANGNHPCAWGAVKGLLALALIPEERRTPRVQEAIRTGVDFLLSVDLLTCDYPLWEGGRVSGNWWKPGFPTFYITDLVQTLEVLVALGYGGDPRLAPALDWLAGKQDAQGRWALEYDYAGKTWVTVGEKKQANPWVTLRATRIFKGLP